MVNQVGDTNLHIAIYKLQLLRYHLPPFADPWVAISASLDPFWPKQIREDVID